MTRFGRPVLILGALMALMMVTLWAPGGPTPAHASITPPLIIKSFSPTSIPQGGTSTLTITLANPDAGAFLTGGA